MIPIYRVKFPKENILMDGSDEYSETSQVFGTHNLNFFLCILVFLLIKRAFPRGYPVLGSAISTWWERAAINPPHVPNSLTSGESAL